MISKRYDELMLAALIVIGIWIVPDAFAAKPIGISTVSNLSFGVAVQGDPALSIPPGTTETAQNASFNVTGTPGMTYTITLPAAPITMKTGTGGVNRTITVSNFVSYPPAGANGLLTGQGNNGSQMLYVGATRAALSLAQAPGNYIGTFMLTVVY